MQYYDTKTFIYSFNLGGVHEDHDNHFRMSECIAIYLKGQTGVGLSKVAK